MDSFERIAKHILEVHGESNIPNATWAFNFTVKHTSCAICNKYMCDNG